MSTIIDWLHELWRQTAAVPPLLILLTAVLVTAQTSLVALSWVGVLRAAYPGDPVRYRRMLPYYAGSVGLNAVLPASAGTIGLIGLLRASIAGSTIEGLVGAVFAENLFFVAVGTAVYVWLFVTVAGSADVQFGAVLAHPLLSLLIAIAVAAAILLLGRYLVRRFRKTWENAKEGAVILTRPRAYLARVAAPQLGSYVMRMGVIATMMHAYGIPLSLRSMFLIVAASSLSSTVALTPGGIGAQTALTSVALAGVAPASTIAAYAVGQQLIVTAWNVAFGATLLIPTVGWEGVRAIIRTRGKAEEG